VNRGEKDRTALVIIDMISTYRYPEAEAVAAHAEAALPGILQARDEADRSGWPVIFANDAEGGFHGSREEVWQRALGGERPDLVTPLEPRPDDSFVHKGRHSAFFQTPLDEHLWEMGVGSVVLVGQTTEQCVLYTAMDAHMRHLELTVPRDAVAGPIPALSEAALKMIETNMEGAVIETRKLRGLETSRG
jgi:nicotinamidase-related amidase